jgi:transcription factor C subunit 6
MAEPSSVRKCGRKRQPNRKYSTDQLQGPHGFSSDSGEEKVQQNNGAAVDDDQFANEQENHILDEDDVDQDEVSDGDRNASPAEDGDTPEADELLPERVDRRRSINQATIKSQNSRYKLKAGNPLKNIVRSKGLIEPSSKNPSKEDMLKFMAGAHPQDWVDFLRTKERWILDPTLPRRKDGGKGKGAMCHHFSHTEDNRKMEATVGWDWYYDQGGRELFAKRQKTQILTPDEGLAYIPKPSEQSHKFLMGPYGNQQVFSLPIGHSMCLNDAWKPTNLEGIETGKMREGWMLNLGTSVKCLDWATNQDGDVQYLAAVTAQPKFSLSEGLSEVSPAFTPSAPLRSCIQIWAFAAKQAPGHESLLDSRQPPSLQLLVCTEWGEIKQLKWCQIPRKFRDDDFVNKTPIGLLAGVWSDGVVRVVDIYLDKNEERMVSYGKCTLSLACTIHSLTYMTFSKVRRASL